MKKLSICIPTFNRCKSLRNCLNSIILNLDFDQDNVEICVSDNCSDDSTEKIVSDAKRKIHIRYKKNLRNIGRVNNYLQVVDMAKGEFIWLLGDDDLLLPNTIAKVTNLLDKYSKKVDFFYVNSFILDSKFVKTSSQPFNTHYLPNKMKLFSNKITSQEIQFLNLINPKISFDFLGGMYLSIFRKSNWDSKKNCLSYKDKNDENIFSTFGNTFPHLKIFANAFSKSNAFFLAEPVSVSLSGERDWAPMYSLIRSVRLVEALDEFKKNGLPAINYIKCKNYALRYFVQDIIKMILHKHISGFKYIKFRRHIFKNILYPNLYLSFFYFFLRKVKILE